MKQSTVDALDEADRLNAQMSWLLFANEQDRRLFGYLPIRWEPGTPLVPHWEDEETGRFLPANNDTRRPIFQIIHDLPHVKEYLNYYNRCRTCQVWWATDEPCWVCGEIREPMSELWRRMQFMCYAMGLDRTEEQIDEMLEIATRRAEEARQRRREAVRKMSEGISRSFEQARLSMEEFRRQAGVVQHDLETFGFPWRIQHEPEDGYRRVQLSWPRGAGRRAYYTFYDEAGDQSWYGPPALVQRPFFEKKPFVMPDIGRRYDPWAPREECPLPRRLRILISNYAYGQVWKPKPIIKEPVINLGNPILEEYLRRQQNQTPNTRRHNEVRGNRGRSGSGPQRVRHRGRV